MINEKLEIMEKFLEKGNNNSLMSLLMLSENKLEGISYLNGHIFKVSTRGREGNLLSYYNYIIGNTKKLSNYLDQFCEENNFIGSRRITHMHYDDKHGDYRADVTLTSMEDKNYHIGDERCWVYLQAGHPTYVHLSIDQSQPIADNITEDYIYRE
jgi:hypothetical protein